jgi:predicted MFS family arabinose efflux permease
LALASAVGLGIARFAYGLLLPDMKASLGWTYAAAGLLNTINAAGYLAGALAAAPVIRRLGAFRAVLYGAIACVVTLGLCALSGNFVLLSLARFVAGIGAAFAFIAGGVIAAGLAQRHGARATFLLSLYFIGPGLGILVSGIATPALLAQFGPGSWWIAWGALAIISAVLTAIAASAPIDGVSEADANTRDGVRLWPIMLLLTGYFFFSAGSIGYLTFMIAALREAGGGALVQSVFWSLIGLGGVSSPFLWSPLIARLSGGKAVAALVGITFVCVGVPLLTQARWLLFVSAFISGGVFFAVVTAMTTFARRNYAPPSWPKAIAMMTVAFGLGQTLGPVISGGVTDMTSSLTSGLQASALFIGLGAVIALLQRDVGARISAA